MWPKLAPFKTLTAANLADGTNDQQLAAVTLEGADNQRQGMNRLYVAENSDNTTPPEDQTWLTDGVLPKGDSWSALPGVGSGATGQQICVIPDCRAAVIAAVAPGLRAAHHSRSPPGERRPLETPSAHYRTRMTSPHENPLLNGPPGLRPISTHPARRVAVVEPQEPPPPPSRHFRMLTNNGHE